MIKPPCLQYGDSIAVVSLSSGILGDHGCAHQLELGIRRLREFGLNPVFMNHALKGSEFLHHHPEARAEDLKQAFFDPQVKGILCAIGGDDTYRLLPYLMEDEAFLTQVKKTPKLFTGFSDTTNNHLFFHKLGLTTFYGPNFLSDVAELEDDMLPYTKEAFETFFQNPPIRSILPSPVWYEERTDYSAKAMNTKRVAHVETKGYVVLHGNGQATGQLLGGCLESLFDGYTGSRYPEQWDVYRRYGLMPSKDDWNGKILFLETSEETPSPQTVKTMLEELKRQGIFSQVVAILVGKPQNETYFEEYNDLWKQIALKWNLPTLVNANFGHGSPRTVLPYGVNATIDFDQKTITIVEPMFQDSPN